MLKELNHLQAKTDLFNVIHSLSLLDLPRVRLFLITLSMISYQCERSREICHKSSVQPWCCHCERLWDAKVHPCQRTTSLPCCLKGHNHPCKGVSLMPCSSPQWTSSLLVSPCSSTADTSLRLLPKFHMATFPELKMNPQRNKMLKRMQHWHLKGLASVSILAAAQLGVSFLPTGFTPPVSCSL